MAIISNAGTNIHKRRSEWACIFISLGYISRSGVSGSCGNSVLTKELPDCFPKWLHTILHSYQQHVSLPILPHPHHHLLLPGFFILVMIVGVKWYFIVSLMYISQLVNDIQHLFLCLIAIYISSLERCLFRFFAQFLIGLFVFLLLSCKSFLIYSHTSLCQIYDLLMCIVSYLACFGNSLHDHSLLLDTFPTFNLTSSMLCS